MVTGDHADVDPGPQRGADGVVRLRAQRVDDADHADETQPGGQRHRFGGQRRHLVGVDDPGCEREHPQALCAHPLIRRLDGTSGLVYRLLPVVQRPTGAGAAGQHDVRRALDQLDDPFPAVDREAVEGGHELVVGIERHLGQAGVRPPGLPRVDPQLGRQHDQGRLGGVTDHCPVVRDGGVAVEHQPKGQPSEVGHRRTGHRGDRTGLAVALAGHREPDAPGVERGDHHLVHGQRAGLVGVDGARRAECLDIGEVLDDGAL
ncbi:MAG TPA: hypothetical protein VF657_24565 [Actinoplanes sp.]